jgi:hypothetical protein
LFTKMSRLPVALFRDLDRRAPVVGRGDVEALEVRGVAGGPECAGVRRAQVLEDVAEDDRGALLGEAAAVSGALSSSASGDERRPAGKPPGRPHCVPMVDSSGHPWIAR